MRMTEVAITASARSFPTLPYTDIKNDILGKRYDVSLVFVGATRAKALNQQYRGKSYVPNVLAFPLTERCGEIFIAPVVARSQAPRFSLSYEGYVGFLFIHACLHLKGYDHGATMEAREQTYLQKYQLA